MLPSMSALLAKAIEAAALLPETEQDAIARALLADIRERLDAIGDAKWDALFADPRSDAVLKRLSDETLADLEAGRTLDCDPATR